MGDAVGFDRIFEGLGDGLLAYEFIEGAGAVAAGEDCVGFGHRRGIIRRAGAGGQITRRKKDRAFFAGWLRGFDLAKRMGRNMALNIKPKEAAQLDMVALGETMIRLSPQGHGRLGVFEFDGSVGRRRGIQRGVCVGAAGVADGVGEQDGG